MSIHPLRHRALISAALLALVLPGAMRAFDDSDRAALDAFLERVQLESGTPGVSAAVHLRGELVYARGAGLADVQNGVPQTSRTVHNIGSISKVIAAVAIMQLVEAGKVDLDAPIQQYVPYFPEKKQIAEREPSEAAYRITLRHILTHTSGIRHYRDGEFGEHESLRKVQYATFEDAIAFWKDDPLLFAPGEYHSYSSHASNLMHGVVESVTGLSFEEYLRRHVWLPAKMLATQFDVPSRVIANRGRSYDRGPGGQLLHASDENVSYKYAGGGMLSTVEDLCRFTAAINDGRLLRPETVRQMWTNQFPIGIEAWSRRRNEDPASRTIDVRQCLSWRERIDAVGRPSYSHSGSVRGTLTYLVTYPTLGLSIAVHGNAGWMPLQDTVRGIERFFLPPPYDSAVLPGLHAEED